MHLLFVLIQRLLFMNPDIGLQVHHFTNACQAFNSKSTLQFFNRVFHTSIPSSKEIALVKDYFGITPFTWVASSNDAASQKVLESQGFINRGSFSAMSLDVDTISSETYNADIELKKIELKGPEIEAWTTIVSQSFTMQKKELLKVMQSFEHDLKPGTLTLYLGYYQEKPAATGTLLRHNDMVSLHWITTAEEFRKKGLGFALSHTLLLDAQRMGCKQAILLSSTSGKPLYERLGFKEYHVYNIYAYGQQTMEHH